MAYDLARLEQALVNADKAGDTEAAKTFAAEIRKQRAQPQESARPSNPSLMDVATGPATIGDWATGIKQTAQEAITPEYWKGIGQKLTQTTPDIPMENGRLIAKPLSESLMPTPEGTTAMNMALSVNPVSSITKSALSGIVSKPAAPTANAGILKVAQESAKAGYVIPPSSVTQGKGSAFLESLGGKLLTEQKASLKNRDVTNSLAKRALGLADDTQLSDDVLNAIKKKAGETYETLKGAGKFLADKEFSKALDDASSGYREFTKEFPELANKEVDNLLQAFNKPSMSANGLVEGVKKLRFDAGKNMKAMDPEKATLGRIQKKVANAVEDLMERNLTARGMKDVVDKFRAGRTMYAKASTIQESLDEAGNVSARSIAKMMDKGKLMTGEMETIGKFGTMFPKAAQDVKRSMLPGSPLDWAVSGSVSGITGNPAYMAMLAARPATRSLLLSKPYQQMIMKQPNMAGNASGGGSEAMARLLASIQAQSQ
jgi:hypothetical protein